MTTHTTLHRNGGWTIELSEPLNGPNGVVNAITLKPVRAEHTIRWAEGEIGSTFALISELSGVPEMLLRQLVSSDFDRLMVAFYNIIPPMIKKDFEAGSRPLSSPMDELPAEQAIVPDQQDPRFPHVPGPVERMPPHLSGAKPPQPEDTGGGFNMQTPETMKAAS